VLASEGAGDMAEAVRVLPAPFIEPTRGERFQADARAFGKGEAGGRRDGHVGQRAALITPDVVVHLHRGHRDSRRAS